MGINKQHPQRNFEKASEGYNADQIIKAWKNSNGRFCISFPLNVDQSQKSDITENTN